MNILSIKLSRLTFFIVLALSFSLGIMQPEPAQAQLFQGAKKEACGTTQLSRGGNTSCGSAGRSALQSTIKNVINLLTVIVGVIAVIMVIIGGLRYVIADGDSGQINSARNTIIYALVGAIIAAFAQAIVRFVLSEV